jgi:hypothetical protein
MLGVFVDHVPRSDSARPRQSPNNGMRAVIEAALRPIWGRLSDEDETLIIQA